MTALVLFEARKAVRNPLLWLGAALVVAFAVANAVGYWPSVPEDAEHAYGGLAALSCFTLLVGAWVGLRDRTSGAESVIASTPLRGQALVAPARMAALALVALVVCTIAFAVTATVSFARGGRALPDPFLVLDGGLYVALAACTGFAIGYLTGSRILSLLAAPVLPGIVFFLQGSQSGSIVESSWLLPSPKLPGRFGPLGYLPDVFPIHNAYLAGALLALVGFVWITTGRKESSAAARAGFVAATVGGAVVVASAAWLAVQPKEVHVFGAAPSDWVEIHVPGDYELLTDAARRAPADAGSRLASACVEDGGVRACVFPEFGKRLASAIASEAAPLAALASLEGVPQSIRMVPTADHTGVDECMRNGELLVGSTNWSAEFQKYESVSERAFYCAVYGRRQLVNPAAAALHAWFVVRVSRDAGSDDFTRLVREGWGRRSAEAVAPLADVRVSEVVDRLEPIWDDVRSRDVTLAELREALEGSR